MIGACSLNEEITFLNLGYYRLNRSYYYLLRFY